MLSFHMNTYKKTDTGQSLENCLASTSREMHTTSGEPYNFMKYKP